MGDMLPPAKKSRLVGGHDLVTNILERGKHPYGVRLLGNMYADSLLDGFVDCRQTGLGSFGTIRSDDVLLIVFSYFDASALCHLCLASRALYVFSHHDALWRRLCLVKFGGDFSFKYSWKQSYVYRLLSGSNRIDEYKEHAPIIVDGLYSDALYRPLLCASSGLHPSWTTVENMERRSAKSLSVEDFIREFDAKNQPVLITDCATQWHAFASKDRAWNFDYLKKQAQKASGYNFTMDDYISYMEGVSSSDDQPIYLFDKRFFDKLPELLHDFTVPVSYDLDLFSLLGEIPQRPYYRWMIMGPAKSGSSFHIDPNATSAWNAVISGAKRWIMFPPGVTPPGVYPTNDLAEVTQSVSLMEWYLNFYTEIEALPPSQQPIQCTCEIVYVPHGWWHAVINIEPSVAITQNFVTANNLAKVLEFLRDKKEQVSGIKDGDSLHGRFVSVIKEKRPHLTELPGVKSAMDATKYSLWSKIIAGDDDSSENKVSSGSTSTTADDNKNGVSSFSFNF
eukprot:GSMAST32.ASY1.ANO1.1405.1 assembled CDS